MRRGYAPGRVMPPVPRRSRRSSARRRPSTGSAPSLRPRGTAAGRRRPSLLLGESGLGKTTLARAYARELGARLKVIDTSTLENPLGLIRQLVGVRDGDAVFLDEIHALPKALVECLYPAIEDGVMPIRFTDGIAIKTVSFVLPKIAWIAATTSPERMAQAFRGRFRTIELRPYAHDDLVEIIRRAAARVGRAIATRGCSSSGEGGGRKRPGRDRALRRGARSCRRAGRRIRSRSTMRGTRSRLAELDENGIGPVHRRILDVLRWYGRPMAAQRLCSQVGITVKALRTIYEPALVRVGGGDPDTERVDARGIASLLAGVD